MISCTLNPDLKAWRGVRTIRLAEMDAMDLLKHSDKRVKDEGSNDGLQWGSGFKGKFTSILGYN